MLRLTIGILMLYWFIQVLTGYRGLLALRQGWDVPQGTWWIGAALCFYFLSNVVNRGFTRAWRWWPQLIFGLLALLAVVFDFWYYGSLWGPPLGLLLFLLMAYVLGHLGLSFLLAGVLGTPG